MSQRLSMIALLGTIGLTACGSNRGAAGTGHAVGAGGATGTGGTSGAADAGDSSGDAGTGSSDAGTDSGDAGTMSGDAGDGSGEDADTGHGSEGCTDAGATFGTWSVVASGTAQELYRVWGSGPSDVWAVGARGTILHWNCAAWSVVTSGTAQDLYGVWGSGPSDVWAVGAQGTILHFDGSAWSPATSDTPLSSGVYGVWGSGAGDVWAVGDEGTLLHWNGSTWSNTGSALPSGTTQTFNGVWGSGPADVWAVGSPSCKAAGFGQICSNGNVQHWNGSAWSVAPIGTNRGLAGVWGSGPDDVWAVGAGSPGALILHSYGSAWSVVSPSNLNYAANGVWGSGPSDVWVVGFAGLFGAQGRGGPLLPTGTILHWNGCDWSAAVMNSALSLRAVWGSGPGDVWAVGSAGAILHY